MRSAVFLVSLISVPLLASQSASAQAIERPRGTFEWVDPSLADVVEPQGHTSNIIFLNRCEGGCTISPGFNDSRTDRSSIVGGTVTVSPWRHGDQAWDQLVDCVKAQYDPFNIVITDVDPGPNVEHFEAIVAGTPQEIGAGNGVGGVSPFSCGFINNAINFSFANIYGSISDICDTVAQETAHSFGLEHEPLCQDPMTYLSGCGKKWFTDESVVCGEFEPTGCQCRQAQNSFRQMRDHFGPGENAGPNLSFVRPQPNSNVQAGFPIEIGGADYYYELRNVEVLVNGESIGTSSVPPYIFNSPDGLSGLVTLEVRGTDMRGIQSSDIAEVNVGEACSAGGCPSGRVCYRDFCIPDASVDGGFGAACTDNAQCNSDLCAKDSDGNGVCTELCELNQGECPADYGCLEAGDTNVCYPGVEEDDGGCGCRAGNTGSGVMGMLFVLGALVLPRRRRRRK